MQKKTEIREVDYTPISDNEKHFLNKIKEIEDALEELKIEYRQTKSKLGELQVIDVELDDSRQVDYITAEAQIISQKGLGRGQKVRFYIDDVKYLGTIQRLVSNWQSAFRYKVVFERE